MPTRSCSWNGWAATSSGARGTRRAVCADLPARGNEQGNSLAKAGGIAYQFSQSGIQIKMSPSNDPAAVVQRQLDAFNARDIDALLATYCEDAEMFEHPSKLLARGSAAFRKRFAARFQEPNLHATLLSRTVMGNVVVDHEEVIRTFPEGAGKIRLLMIYEVQNGRIAKAWSIAGEKSRINDPQL